MSCGFGQSETQAVCVRIHLYEDTSAERLLSGGMTAITVAVLNAFLWEEKQMHSVRETG